MCDHVTQQVGASRERLAAVAAHVKVYTVTARVNSGLDHLNTAASLHLLSVLQTRTNYTINRSCTVNIGSRPSDHYFRSVCLSVSAVFLSRL